MIRFSKLNIWALWAVASVMISHQPLYAQKTRGNQIEILLGAGISKISLNDQLINSFNYSGNCFSSIGFGAVYKRKNDCFDLSFQAQQAKLYPENNVKVDYDYNYLDYRRYEGHISYCREVGTFKKKIKLLLGLSLGSHIETDNESYLNRLYPVAGFRHSYSFSLLDLSPSIRLNWSIKRHQLQVCSAFTLLDFAARPSDNEVKLVETGNHYNWKLYPFNQSKQTQFIVSYQYQIAKSIRVFASYHFQYCSYPTTDVYSKLENSCSFGVSKLFQL